MVKGNWLFVVMFLMVALSSCKKETKADLPFDEDKIVSLLGDMHFAKSAAMIHKFEIRDSMREVYESQVFEINQVSRAEYDQLIAQLELDLKQYYEIEKKVHSYLKKVQNKKN